ncbi:response regulator transcription factor [Halobacillus shinanisalinarum]|uniref:Response regulator transcription factor n=1 Tax=Halobacillus shinanisalinarum TaxID=2932258 RepID=A0ABY4H0P3_9BACI|nr:response regulator transcription factor [Halobacillus shinanisalinarum]UOQ94015.1 response regulator transcription factor [Halobacillus shinanisalinarum]
MDYRILVVDDEWNMRNLVKIYLSKEKYQIDEAKDGNEAIQMAQQSPYDLMVLDIMLPDINGWEVCLTIRQTKQMPILMLTARNDIKDRVHGLNLGADDYLVKPFASEELVARVKALLRRQKINEETNDTFLHFENLSINEESREVKVLESPVELTPKEFDILYLIASQQKRVFTREILLDSIWSPGEFRDLRAIDTHVKNIREKLRKIGLSYNPIKTVWGVGYKFNISEDWK